MPFSNPHAFGVYQRWGLDVSILASNNQEAFVTSSRGLHGERRASLRISLCCCNKIWSIQLRITSLCCRKESEESGKSRVGIYRAWASFSTEAGRQGKFSSGRKVDFRGVLCSCCFVYSLTDRPHPHPHPHPPTSPSIIHRPSPPTSHFSHFISGSACPSCIAHYPPPLAQPRATQHGECSRARSSSSALPTRSSSSASRVEHRSCRELIRLQRQSRPRLGRREGTS